MFRRPLRKFDTAAEKTLDQPCTLRKYEISTKLLNNFQRSTWQEVSVGVPWLASHVDLLGSQDAWT